MIFVPSASDFAEIDCLFSELSPAIKKWNSHITSKWLLDELGRGKVLALKSENSLVSVLFYRDQPEALEVMFLATRQRLQNQGYMSTLFRYFLQSEASNRAVWLEVHAENGVAQKFYLSFGFEQVGARPHYYGANQTAILFSKQPL